MKYGFVILHYISIEDTIECINSLLNLEMQEQINIIVVDNGSNDYSGEKLFTKYINNEKVKILISKKNLGFAKGNNIGYSYAKNELQCDFVIMLNNDTIIEQKNFIQTINSLYFSKHFDILGPNIISTVDSLHQNPKKRPEITKRQVMNRMLMNIIKLMLSIVNLEKMEKLFIKNKCYIHKDLEWSEECSDVQLHGACLIFSPKYLKKFNGLYSGTFMYMEEDILLYISRMENLKLLYSPKLEVFHKEDSATNLKFDTPKKKKIFIHWNIIKSCYQFLRIMNNSNLYKKNCMQND